MTAAPFRRLAWLPLTLSLMAMGTFDSCSDDPSPGIQGTLTIEGGNAQSGPIGTLLGAVLAVRFGGASETSSGALGDVQIDWEVTAGGGTLDNATTYTTVDGYSQVHWTLGPTPGAQTVTATVPGSDPLLRVTFNAFATGGPTSACTNPMVFQDDFSEERSWVATAVTNDSAIASATATYETAGGNPGGYRRMVHHFGAPSTAFTTLAVYHIYIEDGYYTPVEQGAIDHLRYTEDRIKFAPTGPAEVGTGVVVTRNDVNHVALLTGGAFGTETWGQVSVDLTGSDFSPPLDLSSGNFQFGYLRSNSSQAALDVIHGIDNWKMEVCR